MRVVTFSEARRRLNWVIDQAVDGVDFTVIARRNGPNAVLMSLDTFNSWRETAYLLGSPANAAHLAKSMRQLRASKVRIAQLTQAMPRRRRAKRKLALTESPGAARSQARVAPAAQSLPSAKPRLRPADAGERRKTRRG